jgi:hypothetical protein
MKKISGILAAVVLFSACALSAGETGKEPKKAEPGAVVEKKPSASALAPRDQAKPVSLAGTIIDNLCAAAHGSDLASFAAGHSKACALMPACAASGYSLVVGGKLYAFDGESNARILAYLKKEGSSLDVEVSGKLADGVLRLVSVKPRQPVKPAAKPVKKSVERAGPDAPAPAPGAVKKEERPSK